MDPMKKRDRGFLILISLTRESMLLQDLPGTNIRNPDPDPEEECYYSKHVDHAVIYIHVYIINLIQQSSTTSVVELGIQIPHLFLI